MPADEFVRRLIDKGEVKMSETRESYQQHVTAFREARAKADELMAESVPVPTQEENDLLRLGLMHPDEKAQESQPRSRQSRGAASEPAPRHTSEPMSTRQHAAEPPPKPASNR
jgi:hypothetical protein